MQDIKKRPYPFYFKINKDWPFTVASHSTTAIQGQSQEGQKKAKVVELLRERLHSPWDTSVSCELIETCPFFISYFSWKLFMLYKIYWVLQCHTQIHHDFFNPIPMGIFRQLWPTFQNRFCLALFNFERRNIRGFCFVYH